VKLATTHLDGATRAGIVDGDELILLPYADVGEALSSGPDWASRLPEEGGERRATDELRLAAPVLRPEKIICAGLNYPDHAAEANLAVPDYPPLFAKFWRSLIGPTDDIGLPANSDAVDWEVELTVVIGQPVRYADEEEAREAIAGYTLMNDVSMRDWQLRTSEFLQGKTFEGSTPLGPAVITLDDLDDPEDLQIICSVDGEEVQNASTGQMVVSPTRLVAYISEFITLVPGDIVATGTPSGVGGARKPPIYLQPGQTLSTSNKDIGELTNRCVSADRVGSRVAR
jgi:acylpyruvate hydrolase